MEDKDVPSLRNLCLNYVAKLGTNGVDLIELGKSLPPDCFLGILNRLVLNSKISLGLSFNVISTLLDFDGEYLFPHSRLHVVVSIHT